MVFIDLIEMIVTVLVLLFVVTQVAVPMWQNKPYFPVFRKRTRDLESQLSKARGEIDEAATERLVNSERHRAERLRNQKKDGGVETKAR